MLHTAGTLAYGAPRAARASMAQLTMPRLLRAVRSNGGFVGSRRLLVHKYAACAPGQLTDTPRGLCGTAQRSAAGRTPLPEHEYQVRLGAAIRVLRDTLPHFLSRGLVDRPEPLPGGQLVAAGAEHIYHERICFRFAPPIAQHKPPPLVLRGRWLYLGTAQVLRHVLLGMYSEPQVALEQLIFLRRTPPLAAPGGVLPGDELMVRIRFLGAVRLSYTPQEYTLLFRYRFDRLTGMICEHSVDKMVPLPGMWQSLAGLRSKVA